MKKIKLDMTVGKPEKLIFSFAVPLFLGNIFQQFFIVADTMIMGHLLGDHALAAVGATTSIYFLLITFLTGSSQGFSMTIARHFGAKDEEGIKKAVGAATLLAMAMSLILTFVGYFMTYPILNLLGTPPYIMEDSRTYLTILFSTMSFTMAFNVISGFLQALGNSKVPLYTLATALLFNIGLSFLLVAPSGFNVGIAGAAWATVVSQLLAAIFGILYIWKRVPELHITWKHLKPDFPLLKEVFTLAASIGFGNSIIMIGSVILQIAINEFGVYTLSAFTTARKVFGITFIPLMTIGNAVATFTSQNLGAGKKERLPKGLMAGMKLVYIWSTLMIILAYTIGEFIVRFMSGSDNSQVIHEAVLYLRVSLPFLYALSILVVYKAFLQGHGQKKIPVITSVIELLGKIAATLWLIPSIGFIGVALAEPLIWVAAALLLLFIVHRNQFNWSRLKFKNSIAK